ncbi:hypothetical protein TTHERM_01013120 (macronuclear) [Tetrahymena thermophila SB210]|uniref:Uncharacterized protein n=1 Tax=Tetrahymena thermophila (strain SB210) TaxID=312017 RepID=Q22L41_TETTS|nr:hypothetical protein TTHERM_01013120 [Tetrahymena thermophila SB210]EAR85976.1 hypothetical protein TTHERM_01013120 [Tetrahymena thermophila SB210]|eukprot:XP_976571.1 hypothetical protein TTHERM_01013120 [Tetrahymena thermophila SB210]
MFPKLTIGGNKSCISLNSPSVSPNLIALKNQLLMSPSIFNANNSFYKNNNNYNVNIFSNGMNDSFYNSKNRWIFNQIDNNANKILNSYKKDVKEKLHTTEDLPQFNLNTESDQRMKNNSHRRKRIIIKSVDSESMISNNSPQFQQISNQNNIFSVQQQNNLENNVQSLNKSRPLKKKVVRITINSPQNQDKFYLMDQSNQSEYQSPQLLSVNSDSVRLRKSSFQGFAITASNNQKSLNQSSSLTSISSAKQISQSSIFSNRSNSSKQTQCSIQYIPNESDKNYQDSPFLNPYLEEENPSKSSEQIKKSLDKSFEDQMQNLNNSSPPKTPESSENSQESPYEDDQSYQNLYNFLYSDKKKLKKSTSVKGILKNSQPKQFDVNQTKIIKKRVSFSKVKEYF